MKKKIILVLLFVIVKVEAQTSTFSAIDSLFAKGRYQSALKELKAIKPPTFLSNYKTAIIYESIDNYKKSAEFLEKALIFKDDYQTKIKLAKAYQRLKKSNKSIAIYKELVELDSLNLILKYQLGKLYLASKNGTKAIETFKYLIKKDALNAHYSYQLGIAYALNNDRNRMINSFLDTYKKDSLHLKAIIRLASSFSKLKEKDSTQIFVDKGLKLNELEVNLNKLKINQLYRDKKYTEAIPYLLKLDTIVKGDTYFTSMLGRSYYNIDSLNIAMKYFKKLSSIDRENFKAHTYQGHILLKKEKYKIASLKYRIATFLGKEKRDEEYYGLATVYYKLKNPKDAIINFEKAYKENRNNYKALYQLAKLSDDFYKDKKIGYKYYIRYLDRFQERDSVITNFVKKRVSEIKKDYFLRGEKLE